ncbi:uncharacterized protein LOC125939876 [Dermacentor silvarum]|uniref:uncharacterized protein LOC125939876 n=1 Tax=Dermacentor silvarum TaxID=543639 RepID=UPI0021016480|nr:uncharacterized protein LOC125939876 [Dermacentor silvarum]
MTEEMCYRRCTGSKRIYLSMQAVFIWHFFVASAYTDQWYEQTFGLDYHRMPEETKEPQPSRETVFHHVSEDGVTYNDVRSRNIEEHEKHRNKSSSSLSRRTERTTLQLRKIQGNQEITEIIQSREDLERFTIEVYFLADSEITNRVKSQGKSIEDYAKEFVKKVNDILRKLQPPGSIILTGIKTTDTKNEPYIKLSHNGQLHSLQTLQRVQSYVKEQKINKQADVVLVVTGSFYSAI